MRGRDVSRSRRPRVFNLILASSMTSCRSLFRLLLRAVIRADVTNSQIRRYVNLTISERRLPRLPYWRDTHRQIWRPWLDDSYSSRPIVPLGEEATVRILAAASSGSVLRREGRSICGCTNPFLLCGDQNRKSGNKAGIKTVASESYQRERKRLSGRK